MISAFPFHRQVLQSLAKHGLETSPSNLLRAIELLGRRWDLAPDDLVEVAFGLPKASKNILKIDLIKPRTGKKRGWALLIFSSKFRHLNGRLWVPICLNEPAVSRPPRNITVELWNS
jgi:hypothetical protein